MHQNSRFAIVLTHAASADSICKTLSDPDTQPDSEEAFVDVYRDLIRTDWTRDASMFEAADDVAQLPIFPVELGDITERFNEGDADLVQKWVDGCIERLLQRIHESSSPIADLRYLIDSVQSAQKRSEYHLERYHDQISSLEEERNELDELLDALRGERDHLNEEKAARRRKRRQLPVPASIVPQMEGRKRYVKPTHQRRELQKEMNVHESELLESADSMIDQLFSIARNQGLKRLECWSKDRAQNVIRSSINGSMGRVRGQLNKHSTPAIIQKKKWAKRVGRVKVRATKNARKKCEEIAQACIQEIKNHCDQKIQSLEGEIDDLSSEASHYRKKRDDVDDRIQAVRRHKKEAKATIDSDLRRWKRLKRRFRDAADQEVRTALSRANARSELEAVHFAAYARMVQQTFSSLIQGTL